MHETRPKRAGLFPTGSDLNFPSNPLFWTFGFLGGRELQFFSHFLLGRKALARMKGPSSEGHGQLRHRAGIATAKMNMRLGAL